MLAMSFSFNWVVLDSHEFSFYWIWILEDMTMMTIDAHANLTNVSPETGVKGISGDTNSDLMHMFC